MTNPPSPLVERLRGTADAYEEMQLTAPQLLRDAAAAIEALREALQDQVDQCPRCDGLGYHDDNSGVTYAPADDVICQRCEKARAALARKEARDD